MSEKVKPKKPFGTRNKTNKKMRNTAKKRTYLNPDAKPLFVLPSKPMPRLKSPMDILPMVEKDVYVESEYELPANNNRGYESSSSSKSSSKSSSSSSNSSYNASMKLLTKLASKLALKSSSKGATKKYPVFDVEEYNRLVSMETTNETNMETEMCDIDSLVPITTELINKQNIFSVTRSVKDIEKSFDDIIENGLNNSNYPICVSLVFVIMGFMTIDELNEEYETQKKIYRGRNCREIFDFLERNGIYTKLSVFNFGGNESKLIEYVKLLLPVGGITPITQYGSVCGHIGLLMRMAKDEIYYLDAMDNSVFMLSAENNTFIKYLQKYDFDQNTIGFLLTPDTWVKQGKKRKREEPKILIRKQKTKKYRK